MWKQLAQKLLDCKNYTNSVHVGDTNTMMWTRVSLDYYPERFLKGKCLKKSLWSNTPWLYSHPKTQNKQVEWSGQPTRKLRKQNTHMLIHTCTHNIFKQTGSRHSNFWHKQVVWIRGSLDFFPKKVCLFEKFRLGNPSKINCSIKLEPSLSKSWAEIGSIALVSASSPLHRCKFTTERGSNFLFERLFQGLISHWQLRVHRKRLFSATWKYWEKNNSSGGDPCVVALKKNWIYTSSKSKTR